MKKYSDLLAIDPRLDVAVCLESDRAVGVGLCVGDLCLDFSLEGRRTIEHKVDLMQPFDITIDLRSAGSIKIVYIQVDGIDLVPRFDYRATYLDQPTSHMDQPGQWCLKIDLPFYHWLHHAEAQGWLLS